MISLQDRSYIDALRGFSILRVMFGHLGLLWFFPPYSEYLGAFFPVLFFASGAVSYNSFNNSKSVIAYFVKRYVSIAVPFYVFIGLLAILSLVLSESFTHSNGLIRWAFMWPKWGQIFIPIGQIWFLNALLLMSIASVFIFPAFRSNPWFARIFIGLLLIFIILAEYSGWRVDFLELSTPIFGGYGTQLWAVINLSLFYWLGAWYYREGRTRSSTLTTLAALIALTVAVSLFLIGTYSGEFRPHVQDRTAFFIYVSLFATLFLLAIKSVYFTLVRYLPLIHSFLIYSSQHSYAIFLLHTVVLYFVEKSLDWNDLSDQPGLALLRLVVVSAITLLIAPIFTKISKPIASTIQSFLLHRLNVRSHSAKPVQR